MLHVMVVFYYLMAEVSSIKISQNNKKRAPDLLLSFDNLIGHIMSVWCPDQHTTKVIT